MFLTFHRGLKFQSPTFPQLFTALTKKSYPSPSGLTKNTSQIAKNVLFKASFSLKQPPVLLDYRSFSAISKDSHHQSKKNVSCRFLFFSALCLAISKEALPEKEKPNVKETGSKQEVISDGSDWSDLAYKAFDESQSKQKKLQAIEVFSKAGAPMDDIFFVLLKMGLRSNLEDIVELMEAAFKGGAKVDFKHFEFADGVVEFIVNYNFQNVKPELEIPLKLKVIKTLVAHGVDINESHHVVRKYGETSKSLLFILLNPYTNSGVSLTLIQGLGRLGARFKEDENPYPLLFQNYKFIGSLKLSLKAIQIVSEICQIKSADIYHQLTVSEEFFYLEEYATLLKELFICGGRLSPEDNSKLVNDLKKFKNKYTEYLENEIKGFFYRSRHDYYTVNTPLGPFGCELEKGKVQPSVPVSLLKETIIKKELNETIRKVSKKCNEAYSNKLEEHKELQAIIKLLDKAIMRIPSRSTSINDVVEFLLIYSIFKDPKFYTEISKKYSNFLEKMEKV